MLVNELLAKLDTEVTIIFRNSKEEFICQTKKSSTLGVKPYLNNKVKKYNIGCGALFDSFIRITLEDV